MRILRGMAAVSGLCLLLACDDISAPMKDPYLALNQKPVAAPAPLKKPMSKATFIEIYNFIVNTFETLCRYRNDLMKIQNRQSDLFLNRRSYFVGQTSEWLLLVSIRREWMQQGDYPPEHPSRMLDQALYLLTREIRQCESFFMLNEPYDPTYVKQLDEQMTKIEKVLKEYKDPPPNQP